MDTSASPETGHEGQKVWEFKGRSLPIVDRSKFTNPAQAEALHKSNPSFNEDGSTRPYIFQPHTIHVIDGILEGDHQLLIGHKGCGKTSVVLQLAALIGQPVIRVNFSGQVSISDLVGCMGFGKDGTVWNDGPVITAMRQGFWLLMDEFDFGDPSVLSIFHPILEKRPSYCLKENNGEIVVADSRFRVFATGNSLCGDNDGQYVGTQKLNAALLDRFAGHGRIIEVKAMTSKQERNMLKEVLPEISPRLAKRAANFAAKMRAEQIPNFSTRELLNFCSKILTYRDPVVAARMTFLPLVESGETRKGIEAGLHAIFGRRVILGRSMSQSSDGAVASGRRSKDVTDPAELEAIWAAYKGNGGTMSYEQIEKDTKFNLRPSNGMTAYRLVKRGAALRTSKPPSGTV